MIRDFKIRQVGDEFTCEFKVRGEDFETVTDAMHSCMDSVDGLSSVGCSGGCTITVSIGGSSSQSVKNGLQYFRDQFDHITPKQ